MWGSAAQRAYASALRRCWSGVFRAARQAQVYGIVPAQQQLRQRLQREHCPSLSLLFHGRLQPVHICLSDRCSLRGVPRALLGGSIEDQVVPVEHGGVRGDELESHGAAEQVLVP